MHAALVQPAVREQVLKLAAISGLGALAFLVEAFEDLVALAAAVLLAGAELGRQAEILGLLLRAHANVNHRADHGWQRRSIRRPVQVAFPRHDFYSESDNPFGTSRTRCTPSSPRVGGSTRPPDRSSIPPPRRATPDSARSGSAPGCPPHVRRTPWALLRTRCMRFVLFWSALERADVMPARRCRMSADAGVTPTAIRVT